MGTKKILIIQTAFLGDVILATPLIESLSATFPSAQIDFLLKKGNEALLNEHPKLRRVLILDKANKRKSLLELIHEIRKEQYDLVLNLHRFASSGLITVLSRAKETRGFSKNPFSFFYSKRFKHSITNGQHEVDRNISLIIDITDIQQRRPQLYPRPSDLDFVSQWKNEPYYCLAPASVWFTKQAPPAVWQYVMEKFDEEGVQFYLLGGPADYELCEDIKVFSQRNNVHNLAGKLSLMQSAALMKDAKRNFVNDSGPLHIASAGNAPVSAFFCSTTPEFGFGPLSDDSNVIEVKNLDCKPCGLHGHKACPKGHFQCGNGLIEAMNA
jgi:ADP-heptose:LPS heptosyltransferase